MGTDEVRSNDATGSVSVASVAMKLEVVVIPVSDVDRAKEFYSSLGWRLDADRVAGIEAARQQLVAHGADASEVFHCANGTGCRFPGVDVRVSGRHPDHLSYGSFVSFQDPDGNGWLLQEVTKRLAGRVAGDTTYSSVRDLAQAMIRASMAQGSMKRGLGKPTPTGQPGTPSTWCASSPAKNCRNETSRPRVKALNRVHSSLPFLADNFPQSAKDEVEIPKRPPARRAFQFREGDGSRGNSHWNKQLRSSPMK